MASTLRICAECSRNLPRSAYTSNQYSKGIGISRCIGCVHSHHADTPAVDVSNSGRYNISTEFQIPYRELNNPFGEGSFRWVARGTYTSGSRNGQPCVIKWFKQDTEFEDDFFALDIKAVDKALEIVNWFNDLNIINRKIKINVPAVWRFENNPHDDWAGRKVLCEPFIENYQKFNSNTGWMDDSMAWGQVMQALSHFSYHISGGQFVLCDLQGGIYRTSVVLSDPAILSRNRDYGVTDLGPSGISSFFSNHECSAYCRSNWTKPVNPHQYFSPAMGTTMMRHSVPTAQSRPFQSYGYC